MKCSLPAQGNVDMLPLQVAQVAEAALFIVYICLYKDILDKRYNL